MLNVFWALSELILGDVYFYFPHLIDDETKVETDSAHEEGFGEIILYLFFKVMFYPNAIVGDDSKLQRNSG